MQNVSFMYENDQDLLFAGAVYPQTIMAVMRKYHATPTRRIQLHFQKCRIRSKGEFSEQEELEWSKSSIRKQNIMQSIRKKIRCCEDSKRFWADKYECSGLGKMALEECNERLSFLKSVLDDHMQDLEYICIRLEEIRRDDIIRLTRLRQLERFEWLGADRGRDFYEWLGADL